MDRRTLTLALAIALIGAAGCTAPFAKRGPNETHQGEHAASDAAESAQAATSAKENSRGSKVSASTSANSAGGDAARDADSSDAEAVADVDAQTPGIPRRAPALAHGASANADPSSAGNPAVDRQTLLDVIAELEAAGVLDAAARGRLLDDLKQTDPSLWPQLITYFRASLARESRTAQATPVAHRPPTATIDSPDGADEVVVSDSQESSRSMPHSAARRAATVAAEAVVAPDQATAAKSPAKTSEAAPATATTTAANPQPIAAAAAAHTLTAAAPQAATAQSSDADWRDHLAAAIAGLEQETNAPPDTSAAVGRHAALRLLYLADGRRDEAVRPIAGVPPAQQDFWSKELFGLATYLDADRNSETSRRAAEAGVHLQGAAQRLAELATLQVKNLSFCSEVSSFGVYKKFEQYEFQAGQEVLLYAEVENFRSEQTDKGFHTALKASYQILDSHGARVAEHEFKLTEEYCQNARRDYFTNYFVWLPKRIYGGAYTLQLTLEDVKGQKIGQSSVEFTIKEKQ